MASKSWVRSQGYEAIFNFHCYRCLLCAILSKSEECNLRKQPCIMSGASQAWCTSTASSKLPVLPPHICNFTPTEEQGWSQEGVQALQWCQQGVHWCWWHRCQPGLRSSSVQILYGYFTVCCKQHSMKCLQAAFGSLCRMCKWHDTFSSYRFIAGWRFATSGQWLISGSGKSCLRPAAVIVFSLEKG